MFSEQMERNATLTALGIKPWWWWAEAAVETALAKWGSASPQEVVAVCDSSSPQQSEDSLRVLGGLSLKPIWSGGVASCQRWECVMRGSYHEAGTTRILVGVRDALSLCPFFSGLFLPPPSQSCPYHVHLWHLLSLFLQLLSLPWILLACI